MNKITPALLERYQLGLCSEEEKQAVEQWLASTEDEESALPQEASETMEARIWDALSGEMARQKRKIRPLYTRIARYAAAAFVVFGLGAALFVAYHEGDMDERLVLSNIGADRTKEVKTPHFDFTFLPDTRMELTTGSYGKSGDMAFCGGMTVVNNHDHDLAFTVESSCEARQETHKTSTIMKAGKKYILFQLDVVRDNETFVVTPEELETRSLSPALHGMASRIINSI